MQKPTGSLFKTMLCASFIFALSACSSGSGLYAWGNYEDALFVNYHEPAVKEEVLNEYLAFVREYQPGAKQRKIAPGLLADAGTFLLERGDTKGAIEFYQLEAAAWPESAPLMDKLIENLQRTEAASQ